MLATLFARRNAHRLSIFLLPVIPLILAAITHLWNPVGFPPGPSYDEGIYIRRAMHVLGGQGPQESLLYDHPYFSQLFLAGIFKVIGYPSLVNPLADGNAHSIEMLYLVPRVLMGLLAILDTFLIYKISEWYYDNKNVALIASILFAVMPITWLLRRVWLEPIQLPFVLSSILFAVYLGSSKYKDKIKSKSKKNIILILLSAVFLGLAIFTKVPAIAMIPLVAFLIFKGTKSNSNSNWNAQIASVGIWFIPVILIPLIWPAFALYGGKFSLLLNGIYFQSHRGVQTLFIAIIYNFDVDPLVHILGISGVFYAIIKRDFLILLWAVPFLGLLYLVGFVSHYHLIPLLPVFCIAAARMINDLSTKIKVKKTMNIILPIIIISALVSFGLVLNAMLITTGDNSTYYKADAFVAKYLYDKNVKSTNSHSNNHNNREISILSNPFYSWIPSYVFHLNGGNYYYIDYYDNLAVKTGNVILVLDQPLIDMLRNHKTGDQMRRNINFDNNNLVAKFPNESSQAPNQVSIYEYPNNLAALYDKGLALAKTGRPSEAIVMYDKALAMDPRNVGLLVNKGNALDELGKTDEAIVLYERALAIYPEDSAALYNEGVSLLHLGKYNESIAFFDKAVSIDPNDRSALNGKRLALQALNITK